MRERPGPCPRRAVELRLALAALLGLSACLVAEPHADGVVPPGSFDASPAGLQIDDRPRARGNATAQGHPEPLAPPRAPVGDGSTRLTGTLAWSALPRDLVTVAAYRPGQDAPLAQITAPSVGPFWIDVPVREGRLALYAWIDDTGDGPDPTDLATGPVLLDLDAGPPAPVSLVLGAAP